MKEKQRRERPAPYSLEPGAVCAVEGCGFNISYKFEGWYCMEHRKAYQRALRQHRRQCGVDRT